MPATHEPARHVGAHPAEADHADLHLRRIPVPRARDRRERAYCSTTAVPLTVTISMLALPPTVS